MFTDRVLLPLRTLTFELRFVQVIPVYGLPYASSGEMTIRSLECRLNDVTRGIICCYFKGMEIIIYCDEVDSGKYVFSQSYKE